MRENEENEEEKRMHQKKEKERKETEGKWLANWRNEEERKEGWKRGKLNERKNGSGKMKNKSVYCSVGRKIKEKGRKRKKGRKRTKGKGKILSKRRDHKCWGLVVCLSSPGVPAELEGKRNCLVKRVKYRKEVFHCLGFEIEAKFHRLFSLQGPLPEQDVGVVPGWKGKFPEMLAENGLHLAHSLSSFENDLKILKVRRVFEGRKLSKQKDKGVSIGRHFPSFQGPTRAIFATRHSWGGPKDTVEFREESPLKIFHLYRGRLIDGDILSRMLLGLVTLQG